jgi:hypothetical protein
MNITLRQIPAPTFGNPDPLPTIPAAEYAARCDGLYAAAQADWVAVYADREHYANLTYLLNFDPRFEEALLMLGPAGRRVLVLGNEDMGYVSVLPFEVELALCQSFSLPGQKRDTAPRLKDVLKQAGVGSGQAVSMIGWKYLEPEETDAPDRPSFVPAFFVDVLRDLTGPSGRVVDGTRVLMHPENGQRAHNSAAQIAVFEWGSRHASASIFNVVRGTRPGMTEMRAAGLLGYAGQPMSMHAIFVAGKDNLNGLRSASAKVIEYGDAVTTAVGYWGSLVCRAGLMLGEVDETFFNDMVAPYFRVIHTWYTGLRLGAVGRDLFAAVAAKFEGTGMSSALNPGHLGSYEEWLHSPIRKNSGEKLRSGMVLQADIIPVPMPAGRTLNCEDTVALADASLRAEIAASYPAMWQRIEARRAFMAEALGIRLADEVLPLTDGNAYLPPFWLAPDLVCTAA